MATLLKPISLLRIIGVLLCTFSYYSTRTFNSHTEVWGLNLFRFNFGDTNDLTIYYSTAIGYLMLLVINALKRIPSRARVGSMALCAMGLFSLGNWWMEDTNGFSLPIIFMFPIVIAVFEVRLIYWSRPE